MKRQTTLMLFIVMLMACALRADEVNEGDSAEKMNAFEQQIIQIAGSLGTAPPPRAQRIRDYVMTNDIPHDAYIATVEKAAEGLMSETIVYTNYLGKVSLELRSWDKLVTLVNIMGNLGDREFLPWLEKQATESEWADMRPWMAVNYVKIAGLEAVPFVEKILSEDRKDDFHCKYLTAKEFFEQIEKAEGQKAQQEKIELAYMMLLEMAQTISYEGHADQIDRFLCKRVAEYRASVQRQKAIERFVNSTNELARADFTKKQTELLLTPKEQRPDLRTRFPELGIPVDVGDMLTTGCGESCDSDSDGILDQDETRIHRTDPNSSDTDGDGLWDGEEISQSFGTNPLVADTNGDGIADFWEFHSQEAIATNVPQAQVSQTNIVYTITTRLDNSASPKDFAVLKIGGSLIPVRPGILTTASVAVPTGGSFNYVLIPGIGISKEAKAAIAVTGVKTPPRSGNVFTFPYIDDPSGIFDTSAIYKTVPADPEPQER